MKKNISKRIFTTILFLGFLSVPFLTFAQTTLNNVITNIIWNNPTSVGPYSIAVSGQIVTNGTTAPYGFLLEYGVPESFQISSSGTQITQNENNFIGFGAPLVPAQHLNSQNQFTGIYANNLWPSQYYYFGIRETNVMPNPSDTPTAQQSTLVWQVNRTSRPGETLNLNIETSPSPSNNLLARANITGTFNTQSAAGVGTIQGLPIRYYVSTEPANSNASAESLPPAASILGNSILNVEFNDSFSFEVAGLTYDQNYYVTLVNDNSGLFLTDQSILLNVSNPDTGGGTNGGGTNGGGTNGGGTNGNGGTNPNPNPGFPSSQENFSSGLITCNGISIPCTFETLLTTVDKVIKFLTFIIGVPIVALSFAYAGFVLVTSGGNPSKKEEAKGIIGKAVIGLIILLSAWLIVRTVLLVFGYSGPLLGVLGV